MRMKISHTRSSYSARYTSFAQGDISLWLRYFEDFGEPRAQLAYANYSRDAALDFAITPAIILPHDIRKKMMG